MPPVKRIAGKARQTVPPELSMEDGTVTDPESGACPDCSKLPEKELHEDANGYLVPPFWLDEF